MLELSVGDDLLESVDIYSFVASGVLVSLNFSRLWLFLERILLLMIRASCCTQFFDRLPWPQAMHPWASYAL